jgi:hypothetical protein
MALWDQWSQEHVATLRQFAPTLTAKAISPLVGGRNLNTIRVYAGRHGIPMEFTSKRTHLQNARIHQVNHEYFDVIDSPDKAYWLGAILADGVVHVNRSKRHSGITHRVSLSQHVHERAWLEQFRDDLGTTYPLNPGNDGQSLAIAISSLKLCNALRSHGVVERKTYGHPVPTITGPMLPHFVRGFFDGDGCIHSRPAKIRAKPGSTYPKGRGHGYLDPVITFSATEAMCEWLLTEIRRGAGISTGGVYRVSSPVIRSTRFAGRRAVEAVYRWMYADATRWMPRKRAIFESLYGAL